MTDLVEAKTADEFDAAVAGNDVVLVKFSASWCGPCRQLRPHFEKFVKDNEAVVGVEVDIEVNQAVTERYGLQSVPQMYLFRNGEKVAELVSRTKPLITKEVSAHVEL